MKKFEKLNYYEILEIPSNATLPEIERAYKNALAMYDDDSLLTYSLFVNDERERVLKKIEEAYDTLVDVSKRQSYNSTLKSDMAILNNQTLTNSNTLSSYDHNNVLTDPSDHADGCLRRYSEDTENIMSPQKCIDARCSEDLVRTLKTDISSELFQKENQNQEKGPFRKFLRTLLYLSIIVAGVSSLLIVVSYGTFTSWDFLKKFYSTPLDDSARLKVRKSKGPVQVPEPEKKNNEPLGVTGNSTKPGSREALDPSSPNNTARVYITLVSSANIRSRPDANSRIIMITHRGEELKVSGESGNWLMLKLEDESTGWIHRSLAQERQ